MAEPVSGGRKIRSFVRRSGRIGGSRQEVLAAPPPHVLYTAETLPAVRGDILFGNGQPLIIEIGFGMGDATLAFAVGNPDKNYLAFDVHRPGIAKVVAGIAECALSNLKIVEGDAQEILKPETAGREICDGFHIFFPDPWQKKKHHKRRLISVSYTDALIAQLKPGGYLLIATDWKDYADQIRAVLSSRTDLENRSQPDFERTPWRPVTKFEKKGIEKGHRIFDFLYVKKEFLC